MKRPTPVSYRAVHKHTPWRKVQNHASVENALFGRSDGAPGLFNFKARTNYRKHGEPLYAVIWDEATNVGFVVKGDPSSSNGTTYVQVPVQVLLGYDAKGGASASELEAHFVTTPVELVASATTPTEVPSEAEASPLVHAEEGTVSLEDHLVHERNAALASAKKAEVLNATGQLACEACGFDSYVVYGEIGHGFCEVHHAKPLAARSNSEITYLHDLAVLCANCHAIIQRTNPMWSVTRLAAHLAEIRGERCCAST